MTAKKAAPKKGKEIVLKTDLSFEELIEGAFEDKSFKKRSGNMKKIMVLTTWGEKPKKKKAAKKAAKKKPAKKK